MIKALVLLALLPLLSGCLAGLTAAAALSTLGVNECDVSLKALVRGTRPSCLPDPAPSVPPEPRR